MASPFDFINAILNKDPNIMKEPQADKEYKKSAFIVNRGLAYHHDCVLQANEVNRRPHMPPEWQFSYLLNTIDKKKRKFSKWASKDKTTEDLAMIMSYYAYSKRKAMAVLSILSEEQLTMIKQKFEKGGRL